MINPQTTQSLVKLDSDYITIIREVPSEETFVLKDQRQYGKKGLRITGDVGCLATVKSDSFIVVDGDVDGTIEAEGDVIVRGNLKTSAKIRTLGNCFVFGTQPAEDVLIEAAGFVEVAVLGKKSRVSSKKSYIIVHGTTGTGSHLQAHLEVRTRDLGHDCVVSSKTKSLYLGQVGRNLTALAEEENISIRSTRDNANLTALAGCVTVKVLGSSATITAAKVSLPDIDSSDTHQINVKNYRFEKSCTVYDSPSSHRCFLSKNRMDQEPALCITTGNIYNQGSAVLAAHITPDAINCPFIPDGKPKDHYFIPLPELAQWVKKESNAWSALDSHDPIDPEMWREPPVYNTGPPTK